MTNSLNKTASQIVLAAAACAMAFSLQSLAFTDTASTPPANDGYAPLNVGPSTQTKSGELDADNIFTTGLTILATNLGTGVGIGTSVSNTHKLDVAGSVNATALCINGSCRSSWPTASSATYHVYSGSEITYLGYPVCSYYGTSYTTPSNSRGCPRGYSGGSVATAQASQFCAYKGWAYGAPLEQTSPSGSSIIMSGYVMPNGPAGMCGAIVGCSYNLSTVLCYNSL